MVRSAFADETVCKELIVSVCGTERENEPLAEDDFRVKAPVGSVADVV